MAVFRYIAATSTGTKQRGELAADSAEQVRRMLRRMGLLPINLREVTPRSSRLPKSSAVQRIAERLIRNRKRWALIEFYEQLAALLSAGTPITGALDLLASGSRKSASSTLCRLLAEHIRHGASLADAMQVHPRWFSSIDIAMIRSAEQSGAAERALDELASDHARAEQLTGKLVMALVYPALLTVFGIGVVIFLTTTTLPQLAGVLQDADVDLPRSTAVLLGIGSFMQDHWLIAVFTILVILAAASWLLHAPHLARMRLSTPLLGSLQRRMQIASASLLLARLLRSGVPMTEAIDLVGPSIPNSAIRNSFLGLSGALQRGEDASHHLQESGLFEPVFCRVLEVGEQTGELPETLEKFGHRWRESSSRQIDRLAGLLEPSVILLLAVAIGFVVFAAITPMLRLTQTL